MCAVDSGARNQSSGVLNCCLYKYFMPPDKAYIPKKSRYKKLQVVHDCVAMKEKDERGVGPHGSVIPQGEIREHQ